MTDIRPEEYDELLSPPEIRHKALEMLQSRGRKAWGEVEKLVRREKDVYMSSKLVAQRLGINKHKLHMLFRNELQKDAKERRMAEKEARSMEYTRYTSRKLKFSISFLSDWRVNTDRLEAEPRSSSKEVYDAFRQTFPDSAMTLEEFKQQTEQPPRQISAEEAYEKLLEELRTSAMGFDEFSRIYKENKNTAYKEFFETCPGIPSDEVIEKEYASRGLSAKEAYKTLMEDPETFIVSFEEFEEIYRREQEHEEEQKGKREVLSQMEEGYFEASPLDDENYPSIEVNKLKLTRSMSPIELYQLDKPSSEVVPWGNRPSKGITADGLQGIKYYYVFDTGETRNMSEMPKFFTVYLTDNETGWIISCSCKEAVFRKYKEIFDRIVASFRRI